MKIRFLVDRVVQDEHAGTEKETSFRKGQAVDLPDASADHWLSRKLAAPAGDAEPTPVSGKSRNLERAGVKHIGGGWYQLPDGEKVQGRAAALASLEG